MYSRNNARPLYALVASLEAEVIDKWRNEHAAGYTMTDALALHAEAINTKVQRKRGGNVSVTVSIECKHVSKCEDAFFRLQKLGKAGYVLADEDLPFTLHVGGRG